MNTSSISHTPRHAAVGIAGRSSSQELFAYNLELALDSVLQRVDEVGRDAVFRWRSDKELYQNAWSTPTYWDWSSSGSASSYVSEASSPGVSTPSEPAPVEDITFEPPRAWSMIRNQIESKVVTPVETCIQHHSPLKRKLVDDLEGDEWLHPRKKLRTDLKQPVSSLSRLTPPASPPSSGHSVVEAATKNASTARSSSRGITYGEITPPEHDEKDLPAASSTPRQNTRLQPLPP